MDAGFRTHDPHDRHTTHAGETDDQCHDARGQAGSGRRSVAFELQRTIGRERRGRRDHQQAGIPREIERAAGLIRATERDDRVYEIADCQCHDTGKHQRGGHNGEHRSAQHLDQHHPQHRDPSDRPADAGEEAGGRAGCRSREERFQQILVCQRTDGERHEHRIEDQLGIGAAGRLAADQRHDPHDQADVDAEKACVGERWVRRCGAQPEVVIRPHQRAGEERGATRADPAPGAALLGGRGTPGRVEAAERSKCRRPAPAHVRGHEQGLTAVRRESVQQRHHHERDGGDDHEHAGGTTERNHFRRTRG